MEIPKRPLVTIVTPSYNRLSFLKGCVASIGAQNYSHIEHIVVDGASTDGTVDFLEDMRNEGKLSYISEPDNGMYDAINKGMRMAKGDIVAYLNTDDRYFPWSVEMGVNALTDSSTDLVYGDLCIVLQDGDATRWYLQFYKDFSRHFYTYYGTIAQPTVFLKRAALNQVGEFGNGFRLIADCDYWLRCAAAGMSISHINEVLAVQIDHPDTLREQRSQELSKEFDRLYEIHGSGRKPGKTWKRIVTSLTSRKEKMSFWLAARGYGEHPWQNILNLLSGAQGQPDNLNAIPDLCKIALPGKWAIALAGNGGLLGGNTLPPALKSVGR